MADDDETRIEIDATMEKGQLMYPVVGRWRSDLPTFTAPVSGRYQIQVTRAGIGPWQLTATLIDDDRRN